ncbi:MAG TPA: phosphomethylpyrimidine synthase ThiC, partial [bacterium]|nr:phosphomethylpyrimidine synthase ThiC [bacterium]
MKKTVLLKSRTGRRRPVKLGKGEPVKVNANIGTSPLRVDLKKELKKLDAAVRSGADTVMDLSTGGNIREIRKEILSRSPVPVGTVPVYEVFCRTTMRGVSFRKVSPSFFLEVVEEQLEDGVDFVTLHCAVTRSILERLKRKPRVAGVVSRGGALIFRWMEETGEENPLLSRYGELLKLMKKYGCTLSLGDGLRPGSLADSLDRPQMMELENQSLLVRQALAAGVKVILEGPGHVPLHEVEKQIRLAKKYAHGVPLYVLGPIVTDIAPGYDHITSAIGGALAAF